MKAARKESNKDTLKIPKKAPNLQNKFNSMNELEFDDQREEQKEMEFGEDEAEGFEMIQ